MQRDRSHPHDAGTGHEALRTFRGCYGIQVLIAGSHKHWRDAMSQEMRRAGFTATTVDSAHDALAVLVLGLPVDVLLTDTDLGDEIGSSGLAAEARALRPNLSIVLAREAVDAEPADVLATHVLREPDDSAGLATIVRETIVARVA